MDDSVSAECEKVKWQQVQQRLLWNQDDMKKSSSFSEEHKVLFKKMQKWDVIVSYFHMYKIKL